MAIKKCIYVRLGVIYDSQVTNRNQGGPPVRALLPLPYSNWSPGSHIGLPDSQYTQNHYQKQVADLTF